MASFLAEVHLTHAFVPFFHSGNGTGYFPDRVGACGCVLGGMNVSLTGESIFTSDSVDYTLRLYPTAVFFEVSSTGVAGCDESHA